MSPCREDSTLRLIPGCKFTPLISVMYFLGSCPLLLIANCAPVPQKQHGAVGNDPPGPSSKLPPPGQCGVGPSTPPALASPAHTPPEAQSCGASTAYSLFSFGEIENYARQVSGSDLVSLDYFVVYSLKGVTWFLLLLSLRRFFVWYKAVLVWILTFSYISY